MGAHPKPQLRADVKRLALEGKTIPVIARTLEVTAHSVSHHIRSLVEDGEIPRARGRGVRRSRMNDVLTDVRINRGVRFGSMTAFSNSLTQPQIEWLISQTPQGGTVGDVLRALVVDAMHDEDDAIDGQTPERNL